MAATYNVPYSGIFFANFASYRIFAKILSANVLFLVDKNREIKFLLPVRVTCTRNV